jgi:F-type H+-transporting ATPase subunit gamma
MIKGYRTLPDAEFWVAGLLGRGQISRLGYNVKQTFHYPVMNPTVFRAQAITGEIVEAYLAGRFKAVYIVYTEMLSTIKQEPRITELLPLQVEDFTAAERDEARATAAALKSGGAVTFEPDPAAVFDHLVPYYIKGMVYSALVDSYASEQCARMYAMDNATKSADKTIQALSVQYNRARQADITQEITEIVSGIPD